MRSLMICALALLVGCTAEGPTCSDYVDEQLEVMAEICETDPGLVVCPCWSQGLDLDYGDCGCTEPGVVEGWAARRCTPPDRDWLLLAATIAHDECPN